MAPSGAVAGAPATVRLRPYPSEPDVLARLEVPFVVIEVAHHPFEVLKADNSPVIYGDATQRIVVVSTMGLVQHFFPSFHKFKSTESVTSLMETPGHHEMLAGRGEDRR